MTDHPGTTDKTVSTGTAGSTLAPRLGVILVNYRRADDTIECLESLMRSNIPLRVVVVDNESGDGSMDAIAAWAAGQRPSVPADAAMAALTDPPLPKPVAATRLTAAAAASTDPGPALTLIDAGRNGGFAAGNNAGLVHLQRDPGLEYFWLLNNDTIVEPDAAAALVAHFDAAPRVGMCGTMVRFYWQPELVQALGGHRFNTLTGRSLGIGCGTPASAPIDPVAVGRQTDFVLGASLAVSRAFLDTIGPMDEGYFLYFEEVDWAARNHGRFDIGFASAATVFHKEGSSIGSSSTRGGRSAFSDYWLTRSRLRFTRRHKPLLLPLHMLLTLAFGARRLTQSQGRNALAMLRALMGRGY
jgi:GT2 family glycosyltransferase